MAAGLGFKTFTTGEVLSAGDTNGYLMQGVLVFASAAARDAAITSPQEGQVCYLKDTDAVMTYSGATWVTVGGSSYVGVGLTKSAVQSIANATYTAITWDGEGWDTNTFHDNVTNNSRVTIPSGKAGKYLLTAIVNFDTNPSGNLRILNIYKNGAATGDIVGFTNPSLSTTVVFSATLNLSVSDYIEIFAYQNSGGALNLKQTATFGTAFQVTYLGA